MSDSNTELLDKLKRLESLLLEEDPDYNALVKLCQEWKEDSELVQLVQPISIVCGLLIEDFQRVIDTKNSHPHAKAYAYYRQQNYKKALDILHDNPSFPLLEAQCLFHLQQFEKCIDVFRNLTDVDNKDHVLTNIWAAHVAEAVPHVASNLTQPDPKALEQCHELACNWATYECLTTNHGGHELLKRVYQNVCDEGDPEDMEHVKTLLAWSSQWTGGTPDDEANGKSSSDNASLKLVKQVNRSVADKSEMPKQPHPKWNALQTRLFWYNRAVLARSPKDCRAACQNLLKGSPSPYWKAVACILQKKDARELIAELQSEPQSPVVDYALAFLMLHTSSKEMDNSARLKLLQSLPASLQTRNAVVCTMSQLAREIRNSDEDEEAATSLPALSPQDQADAHYQEGEYKLAAEMYSSLLQEDSSNVVVKAQYVQALSHYDPVGAEQVWQELTDDATTENQEISGSTLEEMGLPRIKSRKTVVPTVVESSTSKKKKKSHEAVLRRRARKREAYVEQLQARGIARPPDPERWIPKHERTSSRRRRHHGGGTSKQGGAVSSKDLAQLDARARAEGGGPAASSGPSTAHMQVSGGTSRKGKGRRR